MYEERIAFLAMVQSGVKMNRFKMLNHDVNTRYNDEYKIDMIRPRNEQVEL